MADHDGRLTGASAHGSVAEQPLVTVEHLVRGYGPKGVLNGVDLEIERGEFVALLGPSGCGKSTLLRALAGLDRAVSGSGRIRVPRKVSVVFQDSRLLPWANLITNVTLGQRKAARTRGSEALAEVGLGGREKDWPHQLSGGEQQRCALAGLDAAVSGSGRIRVPGKVSVVFQDSRLLPWADLITNVTLGQRKAARVRGSEALAEVGLPGREKDWPHQLSGGEQQRVALARSLVREPELLLADEPFGALDALTRLKMHGLLRNLLKVHRPAVLLVTHDVDEAITLADRVVVLSQGRIALERRVQLADDRDPSSSDFGYLRRELLDALGVRRPGFATEITDPTRDRATA